MLWNLLELQQDEQVKLEGLKLEGLIVAKNKTLD